MGTDLGTVTTVLPLGNPVPSGFSAETVRSGWQSSVFDFSAYNLDNAAAQVFTYGYVMGQLWEAFDDTGSDVTGKVRFTARQLAKIDPDQRTSSCTQRCPSISCRRTVATRSSSSPISLRRFKKGSQNPNGNSLLFQAIGGPANRIELQAIHGLVNGRSWDVNNQAPAHILVQFRTFRTSPFRKRSSRRTSPLISHTGQDRMTRFDVFTSRPSARTSSSMVRPRVVPNTRSNFRPRRQRHRHHRRRALSRGRPRRARVQLPETVPVPARAPVRRDEAPSSTTSGFKSGVPRACLGRNGLPVWRLLGFAFAPALLVLGGCSSSRAAVPDDLGTDAATQSLTPTEKAALEALSPATLPRPPPDVTNAFADNASAATFGQKLFYDTSFSGPLLDTDNDGSSATLGVAGQTGAVGCVGCHVPSGGFSDTRSFQLQISLGAGWGRRRAPSLLDVGQTKLIMWDGRHDALFNQPFGPLETVVEMNSSRLYMAEQLFRKYRADYEALFGPMPPLGDATRFPPLDVRP